MRLAVISDIHGNLTAFEAVLADLKHTSPDLIFHGGDLSDSGSSPVEIVDRIRALGWPGVVGNTDEMLFRPESLAEFMTPSPVFTMIDEIASASREALGDERLAWLRALPRDLPWQQVHGAMALVHASPETAWRAPAHAASDAELESVYGSLAQSVVVYGHIHRPYIRRIAGKIIVNTGSVSLPYDGDPRASYLLLDDERPTIRRVAYDIDRELKLLSDSRLPHADWIAKLLAI